MKITKHNRSWRSPWPYRFSSRSLKRLLWKLSESIPLNQLPKEVTIISNKSRKATLFRPM